MGYGGAFRELGDFLDDCERRGTEVERISVADCVAPASGAELTADVDLRLATVEAGGDDADEDDAMVACTPRVGSDGSLTLAFESGEGLVPVADHEVTVDPSGATLNPDGSVTVTLSATVATTDRAVAGADPDERPDGRDESARGRESEAGTASTEPASGSGDGGVTSGGGGRDVPPFKDPDLLADVYESCDTFAEMADALAMDVTAETVRRYMIDSDIHEPNSYRTGGDAESEDADADPGVEDAEAGQPVVLSDGIGLPDDVTVDHLIETVEQSNTIYEVKQDIGIDRQDALDMLQELNLLDLVVGRLATEAERDISREDVVERLREASATRSE